MSTRVKHLKLRALLLLALTAACCQCQLVAQVGPSDQAASTTSSSVISGLLREQLTRQAQKTTTSSVTTTTSTTTTTSAPLATSEPSASETKVPSQPPQAPQLPQTTTTTTLANQPASSWEVGASSATSSQQKPASQAAPAATTARQYQTLRPATTPVAPMPEAGATATTTTTTTPPPPPQPAVCRHNNQTYAVGQKWDDDCLQSCECVSGRTLELAAAELEPAPISACRPRCPIYRDPPGDACRLLRSRSDPCCLEWVCELEAKFAPSTVRAPPATLTTMMETDRGPLNVSTTEIRMPPSTAPPATTTTSAPTSTSTSAPRTTGRLAATVTSPRQPAPTTTVTPRRPASSSRSGAASPSPRSLNMAPGPAAGQRARSGLFSDFLEMTRSNMLEATQPPAATTTQAAISTSTSTSTTTTSTEQPSSADEMLVDPEEHHLCIVTPDQGWKVNASWQVEPCNQVCRCVFRDEPRNPAADVTIYPTRNLKNESMATEIRCGLPEACAPLAAQLVATAACPEPHLKLPQLAPLDSCACPKLACHAVQPQPQPQQPAGCKARKQANGAPSQLNVGDTFNDECHSMCRCSSDGEIRCQPLVCPTEPAANASCARWQPEPSFRPNWAENKCCAQFVCSPNATVAESEPTSVAPPADPPLEPAAPAHAACLLLGKRLEHNQLVPEEMQPREPPADHCDKLCACQDGKIVCQNACEPLGELPPEDLECAAALAYQNTDGCCPRWSCPIKENYGLQQLQVRQVNASTVELLVVLPEFALGQSGHLEINYTSRAAGGAGVTDEQPPPPAQASWQMRPSIRTFDGVFSSRQIKYYWPDLKPAHRYWFKLVARFDQPDGPPFDEPLEHSPRLLSFLVPPAAARDEAKEAGASLSGTTQTQTPPTSTASTSTQSATTPAVPPRLLQPVHTNVLHPVMVASTTAEPPVASSTQRPSSGAPSSSSTPAPSSAATRPPDGDSGSLKPGVGGEPAGASSAPPCASTTPPPPPVQSHESNRIDDLNALRADLDPPNPMSWAEHLHQQVHKAPIHQYAWHLLVAFAVMTVLFVIVSYSYWKKVRVVAPITSPHHQFGGLHHHGHQQSAYDNPTFTKLVSYYHNQPHVLLVDENNQNFDNLAKQKNLEVDKSSPLHHSNAPTNNTTPANNNNNSHTTPLHRPQNGRQHLI